MGTGVSHKRITTSKIFAFILEVPILTCLHFIRQLSIAGIRRMLATVLRLSCKQAYIESFPVSRALLTLKSLITCQPLLFFLRKEVIQPHLPIRLPCYDFTPVIEPAFGSSLP